MVVTRWKFLACAILAGAASTAPAQPVRTQTGHLLDANLSIGGGRINPTAAGEKRFDSQLYITGQVTGLSSFAGGTPYFAANQLRLDLPSAGLSTFRQQSVGLEQVLSGSPYTTSPYYERTTTALGLRGIRAGLTLPGSDTPRVSTPPTRLIRRLYPELVKAPGMVIGPPPGGSLAVEPLPRLSIDAPSRSVFSGAGYRPGLADMFGLRRPEDMQKLARQLYLYDRPARAEDKQPAESDLREEGSIPVDRVIRPPEAGEVGELPEAIRRPEALPEQGQALPTDQEEIPAEFGEIETGQDVYSDLLVKLYLQRHAADQETFAKKAIKAGEAGRRALIMTPPGEPDIERVVEMVKGREVVVHGLAGAGRDMFNKQMAIAAKNLEQGKFYRAVADYRLAATIDSANPLARVGMALARFGAGEPMSASLQFRRALGILPALMETRLDLPGMMSGQVLAERLADLDKRLAEQDEPDASLLFLSAFVHHNLRQSDQARAAAEKLKALAGQDRLYRSYAEYVLTGQNPLTKQPEAQQAGQ